MSLSERIRNETRTQHADAESMNFITRLMRGELSLDDYAVYLSNLAFVYQALETQTHQGEAFPTSESFWNPALDRTVKIGSDLVQLGIPDWESTNPTPATAEYVAYLNSLGGRSDVRLLAHHYTRYLGDLSGGQAIAKLVQRNYNATEEQLSFYRFEAIEDIVRYKEKYREDLDNVRLSAEQENLLIAEAKKAFDFAQRMFADLER